MGWWEENGYQVPSGPLADAIQRGAQAPLPAWAYGPVSQMPNAQYRDPTTGAIREGPSYTSNDPSGSGFYPYDPNAPQARPQAGTGSSPTGGFVPPGYVPGTTGGPEVRNTASGGPLPVPQGNDPAAISAWFKSMGVSDPDYYTRQALQADPSGVGTGEYWANRVKSDMAGSSGGGAGGGSLGSYGAFLQPYGGSFSAPYAVPQFNQPFTEKFNAPTGLNFMNDPGYQERLKAGQEAMQNSAAAKGTLLTGSFQRDLNEAAQNFASNEYANVFNRALQGYGADVTGYNTNLAGYGAGLAGNQQAYNQALGAFGTNYDIFRNNQNDPFSKLMSASGLGLNAVNSANAASGGFGNQVSNNATSYGNLATAYGTNAGNLAINQGNVNAANSAAQSSLWNAPIGAALTWYQQHYPNGLFGGSNNANKPLPVSPWTPSTTFGIGSYTNPQLPGSSFTPYY